MRFTYYGYNAFIIEGDEITLFIDPGQNLHWRKLDSLIPHSRWPQADLILVTHGDADHAEFVPRAARASGAPIVCGPALAEKWLRKGLDVVPLAPGQTAEAAGIDLKGINVQHGGPTLTLFGRSFTFKPTFVGKGGVGLLFQLEDRRLLNLGDTLLLEREWKGLQVDVLIIPIGGMTTMDVDGALQAVTVIRPEIVIPMHYNWDLLFYHRPADVERFASEVRESGRQCFPLQPGEGFEL